MPADDERDADTEAADRLDFPVVGIGASAGGLGAFQTFLEHLPDDPGMAFVLVQHLDPDRASELPRLLQRTTAMEVAPVEDDGGMELARSHIYVIPPGRDMTISGDGALHLTEITASRAERAPIDLFFRSLADSQGGNAVGVVLSGTGSGGTTGLKRIKERGGVTLVQDPEGAEFEGMPRSAVRSGLVDVVAPVAQLAERLVDYRDALSKIQLPEDAEAL
ncbi:MAG: chemotaxis protein CheB, partial [Bacteroidetes bacterium QS_9_68_14]